MKRACSLIVIKFWTTLHLLFERKVNLPAFLKHFERAAAGIFRRGLPSDDDLKVPAVACIFSSVFRMGFVAKLH